MNGVGAKIDRVLTGITAAQNAGLPIKINCVVQRGVNENQILPLARWARKENLTLRFIEYMDVGESNGWNLEHMVPAQEILQTLQSEFQLDTLPPLHPGETARRWSHQDGNGEIGIISSVTQPFCQGCSRLRLSADGKLYNCLFTDKGHDLRPLLRNNSDDPAIQKAISSIWTHRNDRYSELRGKINPPKAEMSYLGG